MNNNYFYNFLDDINNIYRKLFYNIRNKSEIINNKFDDNLNNIHELINNYKINLKKIDYINILDSIPHLPSELIYKKYEEDIKLDDNILNIKEIENELSLKITSFFNDPIFIKLIFLIVKKNRCIEIENTDFFRYICNNIIDNDINGLDVDRKELKIKFNNKNFMFFKTKTRIIVLNKIFDFINKKMNNVNIFNDILDVKSNLVKNYNNINNDINHIINIIKKQRYFSNDIEITDNNLDRLKEFIYLKKSTLIKDDIFITYFEDYIKNNEQIESIKNIIIEKRDIIENISKNIEKIKGDNIKIKKAINPLLLKRNNFDDRGIRIRKLINIKDINVVMNKKINNNIVYFKNYIKVIILDNNIINNKINIYRNNINYINNDIKKYEIILRKNQDDNKVKLNINKKLLKHNLEKKEILDNKIVRLENIILENKYLLINLKNKIMKEEEKIEREENEYSDLFNMNNNLLNNIENNKKDGIKNIEQLYEKLNENIMEINRLNNNLGKVIEEIKSENEKLILTEKKALGVYNFLDKNYNNLLNDYYSVYQMTNLVDKLYELKISKDIAYKKIKNSDIISEVFELLSDKLLNNKKDLDIFLKEIKFENIVLDNKIKNINYYYEEFIYNLGINIYSLYEFIFYFNIYNDICSYLNRNNNDNDKNYGKTISNNIVSIVNKNNNKIDIIKNKINIFMKEEREIIKDSFLDNIDKLLDEYNRINLIKSELKIISSSLKNINNNIYDINNYINSL